MRSIKIKDFIPLTRDSLKCIPLLFFAFTLFYISFSYFFFAKEKVRPLYIDDNVKNKNRS